MSVRSVWNNFWCSEEKTWFISVDFADVRISYEA